MNDPSPLEGKRIGSVTPVIVRGQGPPIDDKISGLERHSVNLDARKPGWLDTQPLDFVQESLRTVWAQFSPLSSNLGEEIEDIEPLPVGDLPLPRKEGRIIVVGGTGYKFEDVLAKYSNATGIESERLAQVTIDGALLKLIFQKPELYEVVRAVESTEERSISVKYEGDTRIKTPEDYDVRNDSKFSAILEEPWKRLRVIPRPEAVGLDMMPPSIEFNAEKGTIRMWREWNDGYALDFLRRFCNELIDLSGGRVDEDLIQEAASPPYSQASLSEFY